MIGVGRGQRWVPAPKAPRRAHAGNRDQHVGNPAAMRAWQGYEWARGLTRGEHYTDAASAHEMQPLLIANGDPQGCLFWSLLAQHTEGQPLAWYRRHKWGPRTEHEMRELLREWSAWRECCVLLYRLQRDGSLGAPEVFGPAHTRCWTLLLVPAGGGLGHVLPAKVNVAARIAVPPAIFAEEAPGDALEEPAAVEREDLPLAEVPAAPAVDDGDDVASEDGSVVEPADQPQNRADEAPNEQPGPVEDPDDLPLEDMWAVVDPVRDAGPALWQHALQLQERVERHVLEVPGHARGSYYGIQPPPEALGLRWVGGWFSSQLAQSSEVPGWIALCREAIRATALAPLLDTPDYASATVPNFNKFGTSVVYLPVRAESGLQLVGSRTVTDGLERCEFFTAGDSLTQESFAGTALWVARTDENGCLRVDCANLAAKVTVSVSARVAPTPDALPDVSRRKAQWQQVLAMEKDAVRLSMLSRMRGDEAAKGFTGEVEPHDAVRIVAEMQRSGEGAYTSVGAPFQWGYCFSCGRSLPGSMKFRLCKECAQYGNTDLGKLVATGEKVTSLANPILYPGVVNTRSQHPPLKRGVETRATQRNFRCAPRA